MGLLDDAIREHLELKRLHGADPGEVSRQEREVLGGEPHDGAPEATGEAPADAAPAVALPEEPAAAASAPEPPADVPAPAPAPVEEPEAYEPPPAPAPTPAPPRQPDPEPTPAPAADAADGEREDELEETPDFLQDAPEHDRLWFEQRPPRDFDF